MTHTRREAPVKRVPYDDETGSATRESVLADAIEAADPSRPVRRLVASDADLSRSLAT
jgi:hypothetical protein